MATLLLPPFCTSSAEGVKPAVAVALMITPPAALILNWLFRSEPNGTVVEPSAQTNEPVWLAWALRPAAKLQLPAARLSEPPGTVAVRPVASLLYPPPMAEYCPLAWL